MGDVGEKGAEGGIFWTEKPAALSRNRLVLSSPRFRARELYQCSALTCDAKFSPAKQTMHTTGRDNEDDFGDIHDCYQLSWPQIPPTWLLCFYPLKDNAAGS